MDQVEYLEISICVLGPTRAVKEHVKETVADHWCASMMTEHGYFMELPALDHNHVGLVQECGHKFHTTWIGFAVSCVIMLPA